MVGFRKDSNGKWVGAVKARLEITPDTEETRAKVKVQLGTVVGDTITLEGVSSGVDEDGIAAVEQNTGKSDFFRVIAWFDDQPDDKIKSDGRIRFVHPTEYRNAKMRLRPLTIRWLLGAAGRFLGAFLDNLDHLEEATGTDDAISPNEPEHNTGVVWVDYDDDYLAPVRLNTFGAESYVATAIREHVDFKNGAILPILTAEAHRTEVLNYNWGNDQSHIFGPWQMSGVIAFEALDRWLLKYAIHGADIQVTVQVTVRRVDLKVTNIAIINNSQLNDLYDFDYGKPWPANDAAIVQAGYNTLGSAGHVYKVKVILDKASYPFNYSFGS